MPSTSKSDRHSGQDLFIEIGWANLEPMMKQQIDRVASQCQTEIQASLQQIWTTAEKEQASLAQRIVSDHLVTEGTSGLPNYHPLHWFQNQLEFKLRGLLEFNDYETAQRQIQDLLNQLQQEIVVAIATQQKQVAEEFDEQIQNLRNALTTIIQPQLQNKRIIITEYINSYIPLAKLQLREVDKFGFFLDSKRVSPANIVVSTTKKVSPWYFMGLQEKQQPCYCLSLQQLQPIVRESLDRSFQDIQTQIDTYLNINLHRQIESLMVSLK
jgi:vacuolar-type H+-ATPase subunit E/Vma4